jgi:hypothetical protein
VGDDYVPITPRPKQKHTNPTTAYTLTHTSRKTPITIRENRRMPPLHNAVHEVIPFKPPQRKIDIDDLVRQEDQGR